MKEPVRIWGLGYQGATSVDMKGKVNVSFGKDKDRKMWTSMNISKNLQIGGSYCFCEKNYLPKFYLFAGAGLGVGLLNYETFVFVNLSAQYFFTRNFGFQLAVNKKADTLKSFSEDSIGVFFQYRM